MLTGIMAIFEMATSFESQQLQFRPPRNDYSGSQAQQADRMLLQFFSESDNWESLISGDMPLGGSLLCDQLVSKFASEFFSNSPLQDNNYYPGVEARSSSDPLKDACVFTFRSHRLLVVPNSDFDSQVQAAEPYRVFSCLTTSSQQQCSFETQS